MGVLELVLVGWLIFILGSSPDPSINIEINIDSPSYESPPEPPIELELAER